MRSWLLLLLGLPLLLLLFHSSACTEPDTNIQIVRCPSGEIASLQVSVRRDDTSSQGSCPTSQPSPAFTLTKPCDNPTQFQLPNLAAGEQLLFWFQRGEGRTPYCETCAEGTQTNAKGKCTLQGPPPCEATEVCGDGIDNDCDGQVDEDCTPTTEPTIDGPAEPVETAVEPATEPPLEPVTEPVTEPDTADGSDGPPEHAPEPEPTPEPTPEPGGCERGPLGPSEQGMACGETAPEKTLEAMPEKAPENPAGCVSSASCGGNPCIDGRCSVSSGVCNEDSVCGVHQRCIGGGCHRVATLCSVNTDCPNQQTCSGGVCLFCTGGPTPCKLPPLCDAADPTSCSTGFTCVGGSCVLACGGTTHASCPVLPRVKCIQGSIGAGGVCLLSCTISRECPQQYACRPDPGTGLGFCIRQ